MNCLLACPQCNGAISRATETCPRCGVETGQGRSRAGNGGRNEAAAQSVISIVIDALRTSPGQRRSNPAPFSKVVNDS